MSSSISKSKFKSKCHSKRNNHLNNGKSSWQSRIIHFLFHNELEELQNNLVIPSKAAKPNKTIASTKTPNNVTTSHRKTLKKPNHIDTRNQTYPKPKEFILNIAELRNCEIVSPFGETSDCEKENETPIWKLWGQYQDTSSLSLYNLLWEDNSDLKGEANFVLIDSDCGYYSTDCCSEDEERTFDGEFEIL
eukprot:113480_1